MKNYKFILLFVSLIILLLILNGCVSKKETCTDSDGGKNFKTAGTVTYENETYKDSCIDWKQLTEYYCADGKLTEENYDCKDACGDDRFCEYGCLDGACKTMY